MFVPRLLETPRKALVHCTKPKLSPEKALVHCTKPKNVSRKKNPFFATRKDVESYSQMPGKRILALEISNVSGGGTSRLRLLLPGAGGPRRVCPFSEVASPVPEILAPPALNIGSSYRQYWAI
jgi:hypothetical protein